MNYFVLHWVKCNIVFGKKTHYFFLSFFIYYISYFNEFVFKSYNLTIKAYCLKAIYNVMAK